MSITEELVSAYLGRSGTIICASKGQYSHSNPHNIVVFNANVVSGSGDKLWHGDLDLTISVDLIVELAKESQETVHVLREMDARFENEDVPKLENAVYTINGLDMQDSFDQDLYEYRDDQFLCIIPPEPTEAELQSEVQSTRDLYKESEFTKIKVDSEYADSDDPDDFGYIDPKIFFSGVTEDLSPLHLYYKWLKDQIGVDIEDSGLNYYITKETYERLYKLFELWYDAFDGEYSSEYRREKDIAMAMAFNGPAHFRENPEWVEAGCLYLKS